MTAFSSLPVREVIGEPGDEDSGWPFVMGPVAQLLRDGLELSELTILVGENGVGKSTIIDEPEAGLSFLSQVTLANQLAELRDDGIQVLMATHSPILAATAGAQIIELDEAGFQRRRWNELATVALYRRFLSDPGYFGLE